MTLFEALARLMLAGEYEAVGAVIKLAAEEEQAETVESGA